MSNIEVNNKRLNSNINLVACHTTVENSGPVGIVNIKNKLWVANSGTGPSLTGGPFLTQYKEDGKFVSHVTTAGIPFGLTHNDKKCSSQFGSYKLLTSTLTGTVEGYNPNVDPLNTVIVINNGTGAYAGLDTKCGKLYVANTNSGFVDVFSSDFTYLSSFTDTNLTLFGYVPYNVAVYKNKVYVTFAQLDSDGFPINADGNGFVDVFSLQGTCLKRLISLEPLAGPYGMVFSECGAHIYISNHVDGKINIFERKSGCFVGRFKDCLCNDLEIAGLNGIVKSNCGNKIFYTASTDLDNQGVVGVLDKCC